MELFNFCLQQYTPFFISMGKFRRRINMLNIFKIAGSKYAYNMLIL